MGGSPEANTGELGSGEQTLNVNPGSSQGAVQSSAASGFWASRSSPTPLRLPSVSQRRKRALFPKDKGTAHNPSPPVLSPPLLCFPGSAKCCEFLGLQAEQVDYTQHHISSTCLWLEKATLSDGLSVCFFFPSVVVLFLDLILSDSYDLIGA